MFPPAKTPTNADRAAWAETILQHFAEIVGDDEPDTLVSDLLADLMHFCDRDGINFTLCFQRATSYHRDELAEEAEATL